MAQDSEYPSLGESLMPQYFMPRAQDKAGNFPQGFFGEHSPSGTPYPGTMYMEMARQTEAAQNNERLKQMLHLNPQAVQNFIANQPPSRNIVDLTKGGFNVPGPENQTLQAPDPISPLAQALGYGALMRPKVVPLPRPRPK